MDGVFQVMALSGSSVEAVAVGAEHVLALTSAGEVWGWGNNNDNQLGIGHTPIVRLPQLVPTLSGKNIKQVCIYNMDSIVKLIIWLVSKVSCAFSYVKKNKKFIIILPGGRFHYHVQDVQETACKKITVFPVLNKQLQTNNPVARISC